MCGIVAIFAYGRNAEPVDATELFSIRDAMQVRGPDGFGEWFSNDGRVGLGHRRLAIIDLTDAGLQPMANSDETVFVVFNGEIYNYREISRRLTQMGRRIVTNSDTEILLHLYDVYGPDMVDHLRGMFAFAIWDDKNSCMLLVRDPFGIKPLYYSDDGGTLRVASQVKALANGGRAGKSPSAAASVGFYLFGTVPEPYTIFSDIQSLPPGTILSIDAAGRRRLKRFFSVGEVIEEAEVESLHTDWNGADEHLRSAMLDSVRHHLVADVPVGVFLSAGLDSTTLMALSAESTNAPISTFTLGFSEYADTRRDETRLAEVVASDFGTDHQTCWIQKKDFQDNLGAFFSAMDQPTVDGLNTFFVSKLAAESGLKVALTGVGGDELFGSYSSFVQLPLLVSTLRAFKKVPWLGRSFRCVSASTIRHFASPKFASLFEYGSTFEGAYLLRRGHFMPWELPAILDPDVVREGWAELEPFLQLRDTIGGIRGDYAKVAALEFRWYLGHRLLRDIDWASMAHSIELRVPLVDSFLFKELAPFLYGPRRFSKRDLAKTPSQSLPGELFTKKKSGFSFPVKEWLGDRGSRRFEDRGDRFGVRQWAKLVAQNYPLGI